MLNVCLVWKNKKRLLLAFLVMVLACLLFNPFTRKALATGYYNLQAFWQNPAMPPTSNLKMWLRPETLNGLSDGAAVSSWPDSSGNGYFASQATGVNKPIYKVNQVNSLAAVHFDGVQQYMQFFHYNSGAATNFTAGTMFVVFKPESQVTRIAGNAYGADTRIIGIQTTTSADWQGNGVFASPEYFNLNGGPWQMYVTSSAAAGGNFDYGLLGQYIWGPCCTGSAVGANWPYTGYIAEVLIYGANLSAVQITAVQKYLKGKYSLSVPAMWTGAGGNANWSNAGNWASGVVPGAGDVVEFTPAGCASNCSPTIDASINVAGIFASYPYSGTITQAVGASITIGSSGFNLNGATFAGGNSPITVNGPFGIRSGNFTSTSSTLTITGEFNFWASTFAPNNGTVIFDTSTCTTVTTNINYNGPTNGILNFYNLQYGGHDTTCGGNVIWNISGGQQINVMNNFSMGRTGGTALVTANGGTISVEGNINVTAGANGGTTNIVWTPSGYTGCYTDTTPRALPVILEGTGATIENCVAAAAGQNLTYAGLQDGGQCFGGNALAYSHVADSSCNMLCTANTGENCGGIWLNYIHTVGTGTYTASGGGVPPGGSWTINSNATLASNLNLSSAAQSLSINGGTLNLAGFNLTVNNALSLTDNGALKCSGGSYSDGSLSNYGLVDCPNAVYPFNWTGASGIDSNWNRGTNWSGGSPPGLNDIAVFSNARCGATCNAAVNVDPSARGIELLGDYTGTVTQNNGVTITVNKFRMDNGNFAGGNSNITVLGASSGAVYINGGSFTSTSASLIVQKNFVLGATATFSHGNGTTQFGNMTNTDEGNINLNSTPTFNNLYFHANAIDHGAYSIVGTMNVTGTLTNDAPAVFASNQIPPQLNGGTINVTGNAVQNGGAGGTTNVRMVGTANQSLSGNGQGAFPSIEIASTGGTVTVTGTVVFGTNWLYTSGVTNFAGSTVKAGFWSGYDAGTITPGAEQFNNFIVSGSNTWGSPFTVVGTVTVLGTLTFNVPENGPATKINGGTISVSGDFYAQGGGGGTTNVKLVGTSNQTIFGRADWNALLPSIEIASTGGTVTLDGTGAPIRLQRSFIYTSGAVSTTGSLLVFGFGDGSDTGTINTGLLPMNNIFFDGTDTGWGGYSVVGTLYAQGVTCWINSGGGWATPVNGGTISIAGYLDATGACWGSTNFKITGNTNQTVSGTGTGAVPNLEIASTGGTVSLSGTVIVNRNFTYTSGAVNQGTSTVQFGTNGGADAWSTITPGTMNFNNVTFAQSANWIGYTIAGNPLTVLGNLNVSSGLWASNASRLCSGTINVSGNVAFNGRFMVDKGGCSPGGTIRLVGGTNQSWSGTAGSNMPNIEIASTGGTVSVSGAFGMEDFTYTSGTVNTGTSLVSFGMSNGNDPWVSIKSGSVQWYDMQGWVDPGAHMIQSDNMILNDNWHLGFGIWDMSGHSLTVTGNCTVDAGTTLNKGGGVLTCGTLTNNGTINP